MAEQMSCLITPYQRRTVTAVAAGDLLRLAGPSLSSPSPESERHDAGLRPVHAGRHSAIFLGHASPEAATAVTTARFYLYLRLMKVFGWSGARWSDRVRQDPALGSPLLLTALLVALAVLTPPEVPVTRLLPTAPALAAALWPVGPTLLLGLACLVGVTVYAVMSPDHSVLFTAAAVGAVTVAAAYASHLRLQREGTLTEVRTVADATQKVLLRPIPRRVGPLEIGSLYLTATPYARVGGDFYALANTRHGIRLVIGDVRGKGLPALAVASALLGSFREAAYEAADLNQLAKRLEATLLRDDAAALAQGDPAELFATAVLAEIPRHGSHATILSCGHPPPLLGRHGSIHILDTDDPAPPLNLGGMITVTCRPRRFLFLAGDQLLLYTDGVSETRDATGAFFPLATWARTQLTTPPRQVLNNLHHALLKHSGNNLNDDIAAIAILKTT
ncbi:PP2C family protein-serine/threonine phosphatase [Streptomyces sp. NPDC101151]|uniref:PP2C family protein-serine/threonine phosphatase n=1 Tax=Streptomyces sp. NPDC101151 TaxID=3366115 RepID=UPI003819EEA1